RGTRLGAAMPERATGHLNRLLVAAGRPGGWTVDKLVTAKLAPGPMGVALALLLIVRTSGVGPVLLAMALPVLLCLLPDLLLWNAGIKRRETMGLALPDMLDQMSIAVEAGLGFDAAMVRVAHN